MPHNESQSVSRMKENFTSGLTGRDWKSVYDLVNKSLRNRKGGATGYQVYEIRRQSFTLLVVLTQILANAVQQLIQLKEVVTTGSDTLSLMRDINRGIRDGLNVIRMINPKFNPGLFGDLDTAERVLSVISDLYGKIPQGSEAKLIQAQDQSVAESIAMNGTLYRFADQADQESQRIIDHAGAVSPQGAAKLTAQSIAVLIGVTTQVLRTNSMMLKLMGQNMAVNNRQGKLQAEQFQRQYQGLGQGFKATKDHSSLGSLKK